MKIHQNFHAIRKIQLFSRGPHPLGRLDHAPSEIQSWLGAWCDADEY